MNEKGMNTTDDYVKEKWNELETFHIEEACKHLKLHEEKIQDYLADCVAALCDVKKEEMFSQSDVIFFAHARWLYWYAYRYMTNESYDKIAKQDFHGGHSFTSRTIQNGANKMFMMIERDPIWKKRWSIVKRIIKLRNSDTDVKNRIVIQIPKEIKEIVEIEIKDK